MPATTPPPTLVSSEQGAVGPGAIVGARYDEKRQWLLPQGLVARNLPIHPLFPRPKKNASAKSYAVSFDELGGNALLGMHMSRLEPGAHNRGHRHLDEAIILIVRGRGWSEFRQSEEADLQRVNWEAGDVLAIPANAWHQHFNASQEETARQLAFKDTQLLRTMFGSRAFVYDNPFRFIDRYDDQSDYWTSVAAAEDGALISNRLSDPSRQEMGPATNGVTTVRYRMGGHRNLELSLVDLAPNTAFSTGQHLTEQAVVVLAGSGSTTMKTEPVSTNFSWSANDLFCPPLGISSTTTAAESGARLLVVENVGLKRLMDATGQKDLPSLIEAEYPGEAEEWDVKFD